MFVLGLPPPPEGDHLLPDSRVDGKGRFEVGAGRTLGRIGGGGHRGGGGDTSRDTGGRVERGGERMERG